MLLTRLNPKRVYTLLLSSALVLVIGCQIENDEMEWGMFQGNSQRTGHKPITVDPDQFLLSWQKNNPAPYELWQIQGNNNAAYLPLREASAVDPANGFPTTTINGLLTTDFILVHDTLYFASQNSLQRDSGSSLRAQSNNGELLFNTQYDNNSEIYSLLVDDGGIYSLSADNLYAFSAATGEELWYSDLSGNIPDHAAMTDNFIVTLIEDPITKLVAISRNNGSIQAEIEVPGATADNDVFSTGAPIIDQNRSVYFQFKSNLVKFDLENQSVVWNIPGIREGQPVVVDNMLYSINRDEGYLEAIHTETGELSWRLNPMDALTPENLTTATINLVATNNILFASLYPFDHRNPENRTTYGIDLVEKTVVWTYPASGGLSISAGNLYITNVEDEINVININRL